jgi:outer membrane murein-binding lipoprotein Lpp
MNGNENENGSRLDWSFSGVSTEVQGLDRRLTSLEARLDAGASFGRVLWGFVLLSFTALGGLLGRAYVEVWDTHDDVQRVGTQVQGLRRDVERLSRDAEAFEREIRSYHKRREHE